MESRSAERCLSPHLSRLEGVYIVGSVGEEEDMEECVCEGEGMYREEDDLQPGPGRRSEGRLTDDG